MVSLACALRTSAITHLEDPSEFVPVAQCLSPGVPAVPAPLCKLAKASTSWSPAALTECAAQLHICCIAIPAASPKLRPSPACSPPPRVPPPDITFVHLVAPRRRGHKAHSFEAFEACYEFVAVEALAAGSFASVHLARRRRSGDLVAVKKMCTASDVSDADLKAEASLMRRLDHPHVIRTFDAYWVTRTGNTQSEVWIIEEYASGGELFQWCRARRRPLLESEIRRLTVALLRGLSYLHCARRMLVTARRARPIRTCLAADKRFPQPLTTADYR